MPPDRSSSTTTAHAFVADAYDRRATAYVESAVHRKGADLDRIEAELAARRPVRVLDLGTGGGHVALRAASHCGHVVACDIAPAMLDAVARQAAARGIPNLETKLAPAETLPFEDAHFDAVLTRFSAHHWQDPDAGLAEVRRVAAPSGLVILVDTVAPETPVLDTHLQAIELLRDPSHVRNRRITEWHAAFRKLDLSIRDTVPSRLHLAFPDWIARTRTPDWAADSIRHLQSRAPHELRSHFAITPDGSFDIDVALILADAA